LTLLWPSRAIKGGHGGGGPGDIDLSDGASGDVECRRLPNRDASGRNCAAVVVKAGDSRRKRDNLELIWP